MRFVRGWRLAVSVVLILLLPAAGVFELAVHNNAGNGLRPPGAILAKPVLALWGRSYWF